METNLEAKGAMNYAASFISWFAEEYMAIPSRHPTKTGQF
jgi:hypothetical protein